MNKTKKELLEILDKLNQNNIKLIDAIKELRQKETDEDDVMTEEYDNQQRMEDIHEQDREEQANEDYEEGDGWNI